MARAHHTNPVYLRRYRVAGGNLLTSFFAVTAAEQSKLRRIPHPIRVQIRIQEEPEEAAAAVPIRVLKN